MSTPTSRLDHTFLRFKNSFLNSTVTITASTSVLDFSNNSLLRAPTISFVSSCNISTAIDSQSNVYFSSCYDSTSVATLLYDQVGSQSSFSLPPSNKNDLFILKFNKYGFITGTTTVGISGTLSGTNQVSLSIDPSDNVYVTGMYRGTCFVSGFNSTTLVFSGPLVTTDTSFIIKYPAIASATSTSTSFTYLPSGLIRCSTIDSLDYFYVAGSYTGTIGAYNGTTQALTLPNTGLLTQSSFVIKYDLYNKLIGFTTINNALETQVTTNAIISDNSGSIYLGGIFSPTAAAYAYNFTGSGSLGSQQMIANPTSTSAFIIKYDKFGSYSSVAVYTGTLNAMTFDSYNNLYLTGALANSAYLYKYVQPTPDIIFLAVGQSVGQSVAITNDNIYWCGQYNSSVNVVPVGSSSFYLPTTASTQNNTFLIKVPTTSTPTLTIPTGYATFQTESTSTVLVADSSDAYLGSVTNSTVNINDFSNTQAVITRYTMTSSVSNTAFYVKYTAGELSYKYNPTITNVLNVTTGNNENNETVSKQYSSSVETITQSGSTISPNPTIISVIDPATTQNNTPADTTIVPGSGASNTSGQATQPNSNYNSINPMITTSLTAQAITIDNTNEFVYIAGQYSGTNPVSVYNRDGSYSGFNIAKLTNTTDIFVLKFNFAGQALAWTPIVNTITSINNNALTVDKNGSLYVAGSAGANVVPIFDFSPNNTVGSTSFSVPAVVNRAAFIVVYDSNGLASRWTTLDDSVTGHNESFNAITTDSDGSLYAAGQIFGSTAAVYNFSSTSALATGPFTIPETALTNVPTMVLIKWSSLGIANSWTRFIGSVGSTSSALTLTCDSTSNVYVGGYYSGSTSVYNFSTTSANGSVAGLLSFANTENSYILKFNSLGSFISATTLNSNGLNNALSLSLDRQESLYCSGFYSSTTSITNFGSTVASTLTLPVPSTRRAFIIKWSNLGIPLASNTISAFGSSSGLCVTNDNNNTYLCGFYAGFSSSFIFKYNSNDLVATSFTWFGLNPTNVTGINVDSRSFGIAIDKYNSLHNIGYYSSTTLASIPVYDFHDISVSELTSSRFSFNASPSSTSSFYVKYQDGITDLGVVGLVSGQFLVNVPRPLRTTAFKKTLILKSRGTFVTYVINYDDKSYMTNVGETGQGGQTLVLYWSGNGWLIGS